MKRKTSIYKGVGWDKETCKWRCNFNHNKVNYSLGRYKNEDDAGRAYNKKANEILVNKGFRNKIGAGFYMIDKGNNYKMWTDEEDETIKIAYENNENIKRLVMKSGRSLQSIRIRASRLGYSEKEYHMMSGKRPHRIWQAIKSRALNKKGNRYYRYGGRGITISDKWQSFEGFWEDMEEGYSDHLSIGRIDNDKGYYKDNCRWETREQQDNNTSRSVLITYNGLTKSRTQWANEINMNPKTLEQRLDNGWSVKDAINKPVNAKYRNKRKRLS